MSKKEVLISKKAQDISTLELNEIKNFAQLEYASLVVDIHRPDLHLAKCYTSAVLSLLSSQGYILIKKEEKIDEQ